VLNRDQKVWAYLQRDVLRHIVHLKMLQAYPDAIRCCYHEQGASAGILMLLETQASPFDARTYPSTRYVALPTATDAESARALLAHVPADCDLVFKLIEEHTRGVVAERFPLERQTAYVSYTSGGRRFSRAPQVRVSDQLDERCLAMYAANGYSTDEMEANFDRGAFSLALHVRGQPVSTCFCFPNLQQVWEIGGVHTIEGHRRKGYAHKVVETSLALLADRGYIPRYQMHEDNLPSIRLAESIGLVRFLVTEHFLFSRQA
jgi:predicted GNAT family acetyltransferase